MNKDEAMKRVSECGERDNIVIAVFPMVRCERCSKVKQVLHTIYIKEKMRYCEVCGDCVVNVKMKERAERCFKRVRRGSPKRSTNGSKRETLLKTASFV